MAFQPDPHRNRRRRSRPAARKPRRWRLALVGVALLGAIAAGFALLAALPTRADPTAARAELATALDQFRRGNVTAARDGARAAVKADPDWGLAHATLARFLLDLDDGTGAQAELDRAKLTGFDPARTAQLYAHAALLQGDPDAAIAAAVRTVPRYRNYAVRVIGRALAVKGDIAGALKQLTTLTRQAPADSRAWSDLGRVEQSAGDLVAAADAAGRALQIDPGNGDALVLRGELVRTQFGLIGALPWFEAALARDPANHDALVNYAATLGEAGRYRDMLAAARKAAAVRPDDPQPYYLQAVLAARAGNDDLARAMLDKTGGALGNMPGALLLGGALDYGAGAWQQAVAQWGSLVGQQPQNIVARRLLAAALLRSGDSRGALEVLRPIATRDDADSYTLSLAGRAFEQAGQRDWAARFLDRAAVPARADSAAFGTDQSLALLGQAVAASNTPANSIALIRALAASGDTAGALVRAQQLAAAHPGVPAAPLLVGDVQVARRDWSGAVAAYRAAANLRFDEPAALRLVDAQDRAGDRADATRTLALFMTQNPANLAAQRLSAHRQIADGQWDDAIETLEGLRERVGNRDAALLAELGYAFIGKGDAQGAEAYAAAAYRVAPLNPVTADAWGWALYQLGDYDRAVQLLEKAASIAPQASGVRWHLAQTYAALGRDAAAAQQAQAALLDPTFRERAAATALAGAA